MIKKLVMGEILSLIMILIIILIILLILLIFNEEIMMLACKNIINIEVGINKVILVENQYTLVNVGEGGTVMTIELGNVALKLV